MAFLMFAKTLAKNTRLRPGIWCFTSSLVFNVKLWTGEAGAGVEMWRRRCFQGGQQITMIYVRPRRD